MSICIDYFLSKLSKIFVNKFNDLLFSIIYLNKGCSEICCGLYWTNASIPFTFPHEKKLWASGMLLKLLENKIQLNKFNAVLSCTREATRWKAESGRDELAGIAVSANREKIYSLFSNSSTWDRKSCSVKAENIFAVRAPITKTCRTWLDNFSTTTAPRCTGLSHLSHDVFQLGQLRQ